MEEEKEGQENEDTDESIYIKWRCGRRESMGVSGRLDVGMFVGGQGSEF